MQKPETHTDAIYNAYVTRIKDDKCFIKPCSVVKNLYVPQEGETIRKRVEMPRKPVVFSLKENDLKNIHVDDYLHVELNKRSSQKKDGIFTIKKIHKIIEGYSFSKSSDTANSESKDNPATSRSSARRSMPNTKKQNGNIGYDCLAWSDSEDEIGN